MTYDLFLFDLDDTLLDFSASERLSFAKTLAHFGITDPTGQLYLDYQAYNRVLWHKLELGLVTLEHLKVERFRQLYEAHQLAIDPVQISVHYLNTLPSTVVLMDQATEICAWLSTRGEIGIITNGFSHVQTQRIANSTLAPYISFMGVSDACGFSKPDPRFFEHTTQMAKQFSKASSIIIGDRIDADILGGQQFGIDSCWFNHAASVRPSHVSPRYEIRHLSELRTVLA